MGVVGRLWESSMAGVTLIFAHGGCKRLARDSFEERSVDEWRSGDKRCSSFRSIDDRSPHERSPEELDFNEFEDTTGEGVKPTAVEGEFWSGDVLEDVWGVPNKGCGIAPVNDLIYWAIRFDAVLKFWNKFESNCRRNSFEMLKNKITCRGLVRVLAIDFEGGIIVKIDQRANTPRLRLYHFFKIDIKCASV